MKEKNANYIKYGILVMIILGFMLAFYGWPQITTGKTPEKTFESVTTGSTGPGDVSLELKPYEITENMLKIKLSMNTHSVDLSQFDLKEITTLEYDGKTIKPISAPELGGHHVRGDLVFKTDKTLDQFNIRIEKIPKIENRIFEWR